MNGKCMAMIALSFLCDTPALLRAEQVEEVVALLHKECTRSMSPDADDDLEMKDAAPAQKEKQCREIMFNALSRIADGSAKIVLE